MSDIKKELEKAKAEAEKWHKKCLRQKQELRRKQKAYEWNEKVRFELVARALAIQSRFWNFTDKCKDPRFLRTGQYKEFLKQPLPRINRADVVWWARSIVAEADNKKQANPGMEDEDYGV